MKKENIAGNLNNRLRILDINQTEFAELLGVTRQSVSGFILGHTVPSVDTIIKIIQIFEITFEELCG